MQEHLKKTGQIPADEPGEAEGQDADLVGSPDFMEEANGPETTLGEAEASSGVFFTPTGRNPLKSLDSKK